MTEKMMKLIDDRSGLMECKICGSRTYASLQSGVERADGVTRYYKGSWQCPKGCKFKIEKKEADKK